MNLFCQNPNDVVLSGYQIAENSSLITDAIVYLTLVEKTPATITAASNASPIVVTSDDHGLSNGDLVYLSQVEGNYTANGLYEVQNVTTDTFELAGTAGSGAYTEGGKWYRPVAGAAGLAMAWNATRKEYRSTIEEDVPLTAGEQYIAMIDTSYGDHWEIPSQAMIRQ